MTIGTRSNAQVTAVETSHSLGSEKKTKKKQLDCNINALCQYVSHQQI